MPSLSAPGTISKISVTPSVVLNVCDRYARARTRGDETSRRDEPKDCGERENDAKATSRDARGRDDARESDVTDGRRRCANEQLRATR